MKTDAELKKDVIAELEWDPAVNADAVGVAVKDGVVTLTGHLETHAQRDAVEGAVQRVAGLRALAMEVDVRPATGQPRTDTEIATAAQAALRWHALVPADRVRVAVDKGWVTLTGEVDWHTQRESAGQAVRPLMGVVGVTNRITLRATTTPHDVTERIREALTRQVTREARRIEVEIDGSTATLIGTVHSWPERAAAEGAAWSAPGIRRVVNQLEVGAAAG